MKERKNARAIKIVETKSMIQLEITQLHAGNSLVSVVPSIFVGLIIVCVCVRACVCVCARGPARVDAHADARTDAHMEGRVGVGAHACMRKCIRGSKAL
jgi:hypothetical protein